MSHCHSFEVFDRIDVLLYRKVSLARDVSNDSKVDLGLAEASVLVFHDKDAIAPHRNILAVLLVLPFCGYVDFEMRPEIADVDDAEITVPDNPAMCECGHRKGRYEYQAEHKRSAANERRKHARYSSQATLAALRFLT